MTGIERLRKLSKDLERCSLWVALVAGTEKDWNCNQYDDKTITDELLDISDQIEDEQDVETVRSDAMEAWRWVRDHGGLSHVKDILHDFRAVVERLGIEWSESEESTVSEFIEAMRRLRALEEAGVSLDDEGNVIVRKTEERGE